MTSPLNMASLKASGDRIVRLRNTPVGKPVTLHGKPAVLARCIDSPGTHIHAGETYLIARHDGYYVDVGDLDGRPLCVTGDSHFARSDVEALRAIKTPSPAAQFNASRSASFDARKGVRS